MNNNDVLNFLKSQIKLNNEKFPIPVDKVLSFIGTSSKSSTYNEIFPVKVLKIEKNQDFNLDIVVQGKLKKQFSEENEVTISIPELSTFSGFQIKRGNFKEGKDGNDILNVKHVYTIHHTPNTSMKFENIPYEDVIELSKKVDKALVGVAPDANISPRFIAHFTEEDGKIKLYYANSTMNKTNANFIKNNFLSVFIPDLNTMNGYILFGTGKNINESDNPTGFNKAVELFDKGGWGKPRLVTEIVIDSFKEVRI